ncbi:MAG: hypothetical protein RL637_173 [Pseudomonadota bacterium]|jgi:O-acetyl-ADP-ribose deacetylase (regulator of RNase III)
MIYAVEGDILLTRAQVIAHGVAANDPMIQGLAKTLREHFPEMHRAFHQWCHQHHPKAGEIWLWDGLKTKLIVNLIIQQGGYCHESTTRKSSPSYIRHALHDLKKMAIKQHWQSIALPRLATGICDLEWSQTWEIIQQEFADLSIPIYVYVNYLPKTQAIEP